ncbi:LysE/ArgO family amino acid transporter [Moraxella oblonga]|uniref:LysE/ArgO family amino acid transporter n=1 Tax=Moraxella oblonga TaxID=200413 RepID=UPI00082BA456|nr:LysE/ArgO family amino acid transporter [Moraxella oblonga]
MFTTILHGFWVSFGLIVAIGAQNAYVLKQGLLKQHIFWVCLVCFLCDFTLLSLGVLGFGSLIDKNTTFKITLAIFGAMFLFWYGYRAFRSSYLGNSQLSLDDNHTKQTLKKTIATTLALTLLNPHVYLDTLVLVGTIASPLTFAQKPLFLMGAVSASAMWFFGLGYGARLLIPYFQKAKTWQILDAFIGIIMWAIAIGLLRYTYNFVNQ